MNVDPETETNLFAGVRESIAALGMAHRNEHPLFKTPAEAPARRRLVLADESRAQLIVYDSCNAKERFAVPAEKPMTAGFSRASARAATARRTTSRSSRSRPTARCAAFGGSPGSSTRGR